MKTRRALQLLTLVLFWGLLWFTAAAGSGSMPPQAFLEMDPSLWIAAVVSAKSWLSPLWPAPLLLVLTLLLGRFFCGWCCPLGTSIDAVEWIFRLHRGKPPRLPPGAAAGLRSVRYHLLVFVLGAAAAGLTLVSLVSPLVIATKVHGLLLFPMIHLVMKSGMTILGPAADLLGISALAYAEIEVRRYAAGWLTIAAAAAVFGPSLLAPRFWCRYLCPAGALFSLFSRKPLIRRQVSNACVECGKCRKSCPTDAIGVDPFVIDPARCIVCGTCRQVCPPDAVSFAWNRSATHRDTPTLAHRRRFLVTGLGGAAAAMAAWTGVVLPLAEGFERTGVPVIRPPGARPEAEFLSRCVRCGLCIASCPTNTLQPMGIDGGLFPLLSPVVSPRMAACEPLCNVCGGVCATDAIRLLFPDEKQWAKIGTASITRHQCIAWELDRKCLVCDEVCPYDAVELRRVPGKSTAVPFVLANRCSGCGYCEYHCPVKPDAAIVVKPVGAVRPAQGSVKSAAMAAGNDLRLNRTGAVVPHTAPYGMTRPHAASDLPPGFSQYPNAE